MIKLFIFLIFWGFLFVLSWYLFLKFVIGIFVKDKTKLKFYRNMYFILVMFVGGFLALMEESEKKEILENIKIAEKILILYPKYGGEAEHDGWEPLFINDWSRLENKKNIELYFNSKRFNEIGYDDTTRKLLSEFVETKNIDTLRKHIEIEDSNEFLRSKTINELKNLKKLQVSAESIIQDFEYFMDNQSAKEKGFKSQSQLLKAELYGFNEYDELLNKSKKWQEEFSYLETSCGGVMPEVKGYGIYMTEKQLELVSIINEDYLQCGKTLNDPLNLERRCTINSTSESEVINEFWLAKISENGPYRAFQLKIGFGGDLSYAEQEVVAENFKKKYKTDGWNTYCSEKLTQIDNISITTSPSIEWYPGRIDFTMGPKGNYIELFAGEVSDAMYDLWQEIDQKQHQIDKSEAQQKDSLQKL